MPRVVSAAAFIPPLDRTVDPAATDASVVYVRTLIPTDPATLTSPLPPAAATPQEMKSLLSSSGVTASTVTPVPLTVVLPATNPLLVRLATCSPTPAPMLFELPPRSTANPVPLA